MQTLYLLIAILGVIGVVYLLVKKVETKTALIGVGFILCLLSLKPIEALNAFTHAMVQPALIEAICASMGFAFVMKVTKCDKHLVKLLTAPLKNVGFFLIPLAFMVTFFIAIAIPSAAGCSAAVGATLIPLLMASGIKPAMAAATVLCGTMGGILSPGVSHTALISEISGKNIQEIILVQTPNALTAGVIVMISLMIMALVFKDYQKGKVFEVANQNIKEESIEKVSILYALMPLVPLAILIIGASPLRMYEFLSWTSKIGVAEAMLLGTIIAVVVTWTKPDIISREFFNGMGKSYAEIIGIIIAASVFVAGLKACGVIDIIIEWLKNEQDYVRFGGTFIPFLMAMVTGSGDAAAMAFNKAVTIHAQDLGFDQLKLGTAVAMSAVLGRYLSPILGACIIVSAIAGVNPLEIVKRTVLGCVISVVVIAFVLL
ncbi:putative anaerobic C4-dicarboxylate transporter, DcuC family [Campylobacter subantarcticus LMG 24377]|uniref:C4-dicarboxylate ABC transporter n=1 Tax=Campylobacter subantarcticus TaxID=497724 RepID=A0ABW9N5C7_9BACT|nr:C4-dicarboxylate transporter DcuC [Campylobacter subantarcticus]AJC93151.1 putative anaerobic C4-dicarboxylate transporter, DcuC family [Campylobacter subantarcticus LMG 24377]EAL3938721.1 C4-dicarboxylate ABC transporter [Campylobacter lari]EAL3939848.1 C4-dicarboxylate ABC transporter [Campylobacter lari]MPB99439.1 C4-dicarboxylate ABC transporter [Campylobacter subantarcticus]